MFPPGIHETAIKLKLTINKKLTFTPDDIK